MSARRSSITQALHQGQPDVHLDASSHTSPTRSACTSPSLQRETQPHLPELQYQRLRWCGGALILWFHPLYDDAVVEDRDTTIPLMREMDDNYLRKSDNTEMQRLYLKVTLRVVSTVYRRDRAVSHLPHNKPNTDKHMANIAITEIDLIHFAPLILQGSTTPHESHHAPPRHPRQSRRALARHARHQPLPLPAARAAPHRPHRPLAKYAGALAALAPRTTRSRPPRRSACSAPPPSARRSTARPASPPSKPVPPATSPSTR